MNSQINLTLQLKESPTLEGTMDALLARQLIRLMKILGFANAHYRMVAEMKDKYKNTDEKMNRIWERALSDGYCIRKNGRFILTEKAQGI